MNKFEIEDHLEKSKKLFNAHAKKLPDKGAKLQQKISDLEDQLLQLSLKEVSKATVKENDPLLEKCSGQKLDSKLNDKNAVKLSANDAAKKITENSYRIKTLQVTNVCQEKKTTKESESSKVALDKQNTQSLSSDTLENSSTGTVSSKSSNCDKNSTKNNKANSAFEKYSSESLTFAKLKEPSLDNAKTSIPQSLLDSPSFKSFRDPSRSIQLTEAKPLYDQSSIPKNKKLNVLFSSVNSTSLGDEDTIKKLHHSLNTYPEDSLPEEQPKYVKTKLMCHQIKALSWMVWRESQQPSGGILADDMGLGKTLSMISLVVRQKEHANYQADKSDSTTRGTLIVCGASILHQWKEEILRHCKKDCLQILLYHGPKRERDIKHMKKFDVVITTYNLVCTERKALEKGQDSGLFSLKWERIILDEAHTIKNHSSQTSVAVCSLKAFQKWCATGTPIHNDLKDMYSLVKFLEFSPFDDYKKWKNLTSDKDRASNERRDHLLKSILLRRTKDQVDDSGKPLVEMTKKSINITYVDLSPGEKEVYDRLYGKVLAVMDKFRKKEKVSNVSSSLLVLLLRLQQCCSHIHLLGKEAEETPDDSLGDLASGLSSLNIKDSSSSESDTDSILNLSLSSFGENQLSDPQVKSTKIEKLLEGVKEIFTKSNNTEKIVIVSQWVSMLDIVATHLESENIGYHIIAGGTKVEDRQASCNDFNYNKYGNKIMLLSLKAGGVGLNLIGANHLFLLDLHWNPALEQQACDRIYRVGQEKDVTIHKFVCKGTIEQKIVDLQNEKMNVASAVYHGAKKAKKGLTMDDFLMLFNIRL